MLLVGVFFFFFKQKTAYELRISDWSSDVCSSDLIVRRQPRVEALRQHLARGENLVAPLDIGSAALVRHGPRRGHDVDRRGRPCLIRPRRLRQARKVEGGLRTDPRRARAPFGGELERQLDRKSTRLNSSH